MGTISLTDAKARLSELLDRVQHGEEVVITRHGRPVARVSAVAPPKQPVKSLREFRAGMPRWRKSSARLLREMRDEMMLKAARLLRVPAARGIARALRK